ncbi:MAG: PTS sugar transporter subunit IIA [Spirochaetales bacterium]|nr:PTS sugar transporter subunit IIA [Spirochaetales bacterium]
MNLMNAFCRSCIRIEDDLTTKDAVLKSIANIVMETELAQNTSADVIYTALKTREEIGSTGFENGIAIPHCALENVEEFFAGVLVVPAGVDFDSTDGELTKIFAFIVGPRSERNRHIQLLSAVSRMLSDRDTAGKFVSAESEEDLWFLLTRHIGELEGVAAPAEQEPKNLFTIIIQREDCFEEILKILSAAVHGSLTIIESTNAGHYLHRMPLFASYRSETDSGFARVIIAVVGRDVSNDVIRRINTRIPDLNRLTGVLLTVQEVAYTEGTLDF